MRTLSRFGIVAAILSWACTGHAAELDGARLSPQGARFAPLAAIQARAALRGLRIRQVRWDAVLRQSWAVLEDVDHPERPLWAELTDPVPPAPGTPGAAAVSASSAAFVPPKPVVLAVHYGDRVRLWRIEKNVRLEMTAVTEGSAAVGDEVRLHILGSGTDGDAGWRVTGIVRGPGDVEME